MAEKINTIVFPIVRRDRIFTALRSLHENTPRNYSTVVVDQTQPDWEFTQRLWELSDVVIKPHENYGFAQAANIGLRIAPTEYVTVCNDDVEFIPGHDWWGGVVETFERFDGERPPAAVNPQSPKVPGWGYGEPGYRYLVPENWSDPQLDWMGRRARELQEDFRETRLALDEDERDEELRARYEELRSELSAHHEEMAQPVYDAVMSGPEYVERLVEDQNGAVIDGFPCWLAVFKRDRLEEIGLFDERFFPGGGEDYDAMFRAYDANYRMLASSLSWVYHYWGRSKDAPDGLRDALPNAREPWNILSTKADPEQGLYHPDLDVWARTGHRTDPNIYQAPL